jgi:drug/metabolite transporter (DMT)-like permease
MSSKKLWLTWALLTTVLWGIWGAFTGVPAQNGFPETLTYCVWALTMLPPAAFALSRVGWQIQRDGRSMLYGLAIGLLGAGGQMLLFHTVRIGPPYLIFPLIALSPVVTILLSMLLLQERVSRRGTLGIILALLSLPLFDYSGEHPAGFGASWFVCALIIMAAWGVQAYLMRFANGFMSAESIFVYMMATAILLTPAAVYLTDFSQLINWGLKGPYLSALIQILNSVGALSLVYAFRYGRAMVVAPLTNAGAPLITALLSLLLLGVVPSSLKALGIALAFAAAVILALEPDQPIPAHRTREPKPREHA